MKITDKQIQEWKAKYGEVYELPVDDKVCYLKAPSMLEWKRAFNGLSKNGDTGFAEEFLDALWLGGDEEIKKDDDYFLSAKDYLMDLFDYPEAETEKMENGFKITIVGKSCTVRKIERSDLKKSERLNPESRAFITQEALFNIVCLEKDKVFDDRNNSNIRFPLYKALEKLQKQKYASIKKL